jgi:hypothetical protein
MAAALRREFRIDPERLRNLVLSGIAAAEGGDFRYWKEIFDRLDGKTISKIELTDRKIDWSELDNEGDTERPSIDPTGLKSLPQGGEA